MSETLSIIAPGVPTKREAVHRTKRVSQVGRGMRTSIRQRLCVAVTGLCSAGLAAAQATVLAGLSLHDLSIEELGNILIESVSRRDQPLLKAAASVYVIRGDDIRRLGATTLPEALRLAPNLQVAAIDARQYAISARGFNGNVANKLLVMVDGRTIYSPLFSGVFWDAQDFVPSDIDRIEVISGAAGVTWGTNAVNGVINVVTKSAAETPGTTLAATWGNLERTVVARYGAELAPGLAWRAHMRAFRRDASVLPGGLVGDASKGVSAGLRGDWTRGDDKVMLTAGFYDGSTDERPVSGSVDLHGASVTARWTRQLSNESNLDLQAYIDSSHRADKYLLQEDADIADLEAKYRHTGGRHRWLLGASVRQARDRAEPGLLFAFIPAEQRQRWASVFVQDEIQVGRQLSMTLGLRMERNPYTGWEALPSVRAGYELDASSLLWAALSRAVRSPARFDREIFAPPRAPYVIAGGPGFRSEIANVAELGYRTQLGPDASLSLTGFIHDLDRLRSGELVGRTVVIGNQIEGQVRGLEAWGHWQAQRGWRIDGGLLWLDKDLRLKPGSTDPVGPSNLGNDAKLQWSLRSTHSFGDRLDLGLAVRHVGRLPSPKIPSYTATDLTLNWSIRNDLRVAMGVRDAFNRGHSEYQGFASVSEIPRSGFVTLSLDLP